MTKFVTPRPVAWFFFLAAFGTCVALGTWQVKRLEWKQGVMHAIAEAGKEAPLTRLPSDPEALEKLNFRPVTVSGIWRHDIEYHLAPRYYNSQFGYWIITPLELKDRRLIFINRGWIPAKKKEIGERPETIVAGRGHVTGLLRVGNERNRFTPENQPEKNVWFGRDVKEMAAFYELENVIPAMVDAIGEQDINALPVPSNGSIKLRNDHLSYIITWYGLALGILVVFLVYHRKKR